MRYEWIFWVFLLVILISLFEAYGILFFIAFVLIFALKRVWDSREDLKMAIWNAETTIWGKPLEKEFWKKGEFKNKKVKLVWKKKKDQ